jgi:hypothetical protein
LTVIVQAHEAQQVELVALVTLHDQFGIDKARVGQMD